MIDVRLKYNHGYKWHSYKNISAKGYLFDSKGELWKGEKLPQFFSDCMNVESFKKKLEESNGLFSVVIKEDAFLLAAVDKIRMFPLFYKISNSDITLSDKSEIFAENFSLNQLSVPEFLSLGFVSSNETLIENVCQIEAGQLLLFEKNQHRSLWYDKVEGNDVREKDYQKNEKCLIEKIEEMFFRTSKLLSNRKIAVPLSGGYDSRLIALMLKKNGFENVLCFSYGRKDNPESVISEKIARKLGFQWEFVEYNKDIYDNYLNEKDFNDFAVFSSNFCSMPFLQEYFAVKYLKENNFIDENTVFVPGHSIGSMVGGSTTPEKSNKENIDDITSVIFNDNYILNKVSKDSKFKLINKIKSHQLKLFNSDFSSSIDLFLNWSMKERQAKFVGNSTNVYNWFGFEHTLPFINLDFVKFYASMSPDFIYYKKFYADVLRSKYFLPNSLLLDKEIQPKPADFKKHAVKKRFKAIVPKSILKKKLAKYDTICYNELTKKMEKQLDNDNVIVKRSFNSYNEIIVKWFVDFLKKKYNVDL